MALRDDAARKHGGTRRLDVAYLEASALHAPGELVIAPAGAGEFDARATLWTALRVVDSAANRPRERSDLSTLEM